MKYDKKIKNRIKRVEGQLRGIVKMMDDEKECREIITQLSATRKGIDKAIALIVGENLEKCIRENINNGIETKVLVQEAVELLVKSN